MQTPEISIIVPVYNAEKYLEQCLDSIINQSFSNFELICVNDGSNDSSRMLLEEYKKHDSRIIIIDKPNGGLSSARNAGMKKARGRYIGFIDADDLCRAGMFEKLYNNITVLNTDISMCAVHLYCSETHKIDDSNSYFNLSAFSRGFENKVFSFEDTKEFLMEIPVTAWNKLYRRSFLESLKAEFPEGKIFEDGAFFFSVYFKTNRVSIVKEPLYIYRINREGSIIQKGGRSFLDIIDIVNMMFDELKASSIYEDAKYSFYKHKADDIIYRYKFIPQKYKKEFSKKLRNSCLLNENYFDFTLINQKEPVTYRSLLEIKHKADAAEFYLYKLKSKFMRKIIQVLHTDDNNYYFKLKSLKFYLKKRPFFINIQYENDRLNILLFNKFKFNFKFEYSKLPKT